MPYIEKSHKRLPWEWKPETNGAFTKNALLVMLYKTPRWRKLRQIILSENPYCVICKTKGITKLANTVDHIKAASKGGDFWDRSNLQSLCKSCNLSKQDK